MYKHYRVLAKITLRSEIDASDWQKKKLLDVRWVQDNSTPSAPRTLLDLSVGITRERLQPERQNRWIYINVLIFYKSIKLYTNLNFLFNVIMASLVCELLAFHSLHMVFTRFCNAKFVMATRRRSGCSAGRPRPLI